MSTVNQRPGLAIFKDTIYELRANGYVAKYMGPGKSWQYVPASNGTTAQFAVGNTIYQCDNQGAISVLKSDNTWKVIDRNPERKLIAASAKFIYKVHVDQNRIYQYSSKDWNLVDDGVKAIAIAVDADDTLYQLHEGGGAISQYLGSEGWKEIDSTPNVKNILVGAGKLYKVHQDNSIYVHVEDHDWDRIDKNPTTKQVAAGPAGVYQKRTDGTVLKYDESDKKWVQVLSAQPAYLEIAVGETTVYSRHQNGYVYRHEPSNNTWPALT